jgi:inner membrane transporter RhtA
MVLTAIVSIQVGAALATKLFPVLGALGTVSYRVLFAALVLMLVCRPRVYLSSGRNLLLLLAFGGVIAAMNALFYLAIERVPLGIVVAIEFLGPLGLAAVTSTRWLERVWMGLALLGVALLAPFSGGGFDPVGLIYATLAGVGWAGFVVLSVRVGRVFTGSSGIALGMSVATILLLPFAVGPAPALFSSATLLAVMVGVALLSTAIPFSLEFHALKRLTPTVYGALISLEPAVAAMVGALVLGEVLGGRGLLAVGCVTVAAVGSTLKKRRPSD